MLRIKALCVAALAAQTERTGASPVLVVTALAPMLRGQPGRNPGDPPSQGLRRTGNDDTTRHLLGRSVRVLAFLLRRAFRRRAGRYGGQDGGQVGLAFVP
jgi:hypothetical protein